MRPDLYDRGVMFKTKLKKVGGSHAHKFAQYMVSSRDSARVAMICYCERKDSVTVKGVCNMTRFDFSVCNRCNKSEFDSLGASVSLVDWLRRTLPAEVFAALCVEMIDAFEREQESLLLFARVAKDDSNRKSLALFRDRIVSVMGELDEKGGES